MKRLLIILVVIFLALLPATIALAYVIPLPTSYSIDSIEGYHHYIETNDQLYLVKYTITYGAIPTINTQSSWLVRLMNGVTELGVTSPFSYHTSGYGQGISVIYFPAVSAPTWSGNYTVRLEGSAMLTWVGGVPPLVTNSTFTKWSTSTTVSATSTELQLRILYLANQLGTAWTDPLIQTVSGVQVFTTNGETYFENVFPLLRTTCPDLFSQVSGSPTKDIRTHNTSAAITSDNQLVGTPFDMTPLATFLGISRMWATGGVWTLFWLGLTTAIVWRTKATRIALFVFGFAMIAGAVTGFMGMLVGVLVGIFGGISIVFAFFWRGSP